MPTVCKITLDATDYKTELAKVIADTQSAGASLAGGLSVKAPAPSVAPAVSAQAAQEACNKSVRQGTAAETTEVAASKAHAGAMQQAEQAARAQAEAEKARAQALQAGAGSAKSAASAQSAQSASMQAASANMNKGAEQISKAGGAVGAVSGALGAVNPQIGAIGQAISALVAGPISLVTVAIGLIVSASVSLYQSLTQSQEELASIAAKNAAMSMEEAEAEKKKASAMQNYMDRLRELSVTQGQDINVMQETSSILGILVSQYGDLGAVIDKTTGKISNMDEVQNRVTQRQRERLLEKMTAALSDDMRVNDLHLKMGLKKNRYWGADPEEETKKLRSMSDKDAMNLFKGQLQNATSQEAVDFWTDMIARRKKESEQKKQISKFGATGFLSEEDENAAKARIAQSISSESSNQKRIKRERSETSRNDQISRADNPELKKSLLDDKLASYREQRKNLEKSRSSLPTETADMDETQKLQLKERAAKLETEIQQALSREVSVEREIDALKHDQEKRGAALLDQSEYEVEYRTLIDKGLYDEAAALKQNYELRQQNLVLSEKKKQEILQRKKALEQMDTAKETQDLSDQVALQKLLTNGRYEEAAALQMQIDLKQKKKNLTDEEKKKLDDQKKAMAEENLRGNLLDKVRGMKYDAMRKGGNGLESDTEKALEDARKLKKRDLTSDESAMVKQITRLQYDMSNTRDAQLGDGSVKTNALTSRGGFAGGAAMPDKDRINQAIQSNTKHLQVTQEKILNLLQKILD